MPAHPLKTTELSAVNTMLEVIGETPIDSLTDLLPVDAATARSILDETSRDVQSKGWNFNREFGYPLTPDSKTGEISVPETFVHIELAGHDAVIRGTRLYDRRNHTYKFDPKQKYKADVIILLPFSDLPEQARHYITIRAARIFQSRAIGSDTLHGFAQEEEYRALAELRRFDARMNDTTMLGRRKNILHRWRPGKVLER